MAEINFSGTIVYMFCEYEVKTTVIIVVLAILIRYFVLKYTPTKYFYDDIEITNCPKIVEVQTEPTNLRRINDITDTFDDAASMYVL
jgi:hypothetical protein